MIQYNNWFRRCVFGAIMVIVSVTVVAQVSLSSEMKGNQIFSLQGRDKSAVLYYDHADFVVVKKVSELFVEDVQKVTGKRLV